MIPLSVVIITHNEEANIIRCLTSVRMVADEIIVVDSYSTDRTVLICRDQGCRVFERAFDGYGPQKQFAVDQANNDWVFSIDADEVVTADLREELFRIFGKAGQIGSLESESRMTEGQPAGFVVPFSLHFMGKELKHGGVGGESHLRLFNRRRGHFTQVPVHEGIEVNGRIVPVKGKILHYSYRNISHHISKINTYTTQAAEGYRKRGKSFPRAWVFLKFPTSFISFYVIKGGILDGYQGFMWSFLAAVYAMLKVAKTVEIQEQQV
jgi:glycosyltransferase involved in cell wall biosynthesis